VLTDPKKKSPLWAYILVSAAVVALDQLFKAWVRANIPLYPSAAEQIPLIPGVIHLSHIRNAGVAFGLLQGGRWAFLALLGVFCGLVIWAIATGKLTAPWEKWLGVLAMAGALGNGIDRALYGYVVDMLEVEFISFPVFNLADCVINVSCVLFMLLTLFKKEETEKGRT
jgi:signal peptidase II